MTRNVKGERERLEREGETDPPRNHGSIAASGSTSSGEEEGVGETDVTFEPKNSIVRLGLP